jgi:hypothetical protein
LVASIRPSNRRLRWPLAETRKWEISDIVADFRQEIELAWP